MRKLIQMCRRAMAGVAVVLGCSSAFAQIPVTDAIAMAQRQMEQSIQQSSWAQQYGQMIESLEKYQQQIKNQMAQIQAVTGSRGMSLVGADTVRQQLPADFMQTYDKLRSMGSGGASASAKAIYEGIRTYGCSERFPSDAQQRISCEATAMSTPQNIDLLNQSVKSAQQRQSQIQQLMAKVDGTADVKAAADLQNRIAVEMTYLQNEKMMMDMAVRQQEQQFALTQQQQGEAGAKRLSSSGGSVNPFNLQ